jgi:hypothetical protein
MLKKSPNITFLCLLGFVFLLASCAPPDDGDGNGNGNGPVGNPTSFTASPGVTTVDLSWSAVSGATGYTLERQEGSGSFVSVFSNQAGTTFEDTGLKASTTYTYRLRAAKDATLSSGKTTTTTTKEEGSAIPVSVLTPIWTSKQAVNVNSFTQGGEIQAVKNAATNVTVSGSSISISGNGEAMYYLGGECTKLTASASGSGTFRVVADDEQLWTGAGATGDLNLVGKQSVSFVFQGSGTGTWADANVYCQSTPSAPAASSPYISGRWGAVFDWGTGTPPAGYQYGKIVPTHAANLPDGSIATWAAWKETTYGNKPDETPQFRNQTAGFVWNPSQGTGANSFAVANNPTHDMFCAGLAVMSDGEVFAAGGGSLGTAGGLDSQKRTSYFNPFTKAWTEILNGSSPAMNVAHWYGTAVSLPDDRVFVVGGSSGDDLFDSIEFRGPTKASPWTHSASSAIAMYPSQEEINIPIPSGTPNFSNGTNANQAEHGEVQAWYPFLNVAPNGQLFQSGPIPRLINFTVQGTTVTGSPAVPAPAGAAQMRTWGNSIMYDEGKLLVTGGSVVRGAGATNTGFTIDINGGNISPEAVPPMRFRRAHQNSVVLPTGDVLMVGGNTSGKQFTDGSGFTCPYRNWANSTATPDVCNGGSFSGDANANNRWPTDIATESVLTPELFSPDKRAWRDLADMTVPRNYHSVGILLQDGRVLAAGGGLCGDLNGRVDGVPCNHPNGQIFEPPYLFKSDGTLASRPTIGSLSASNNGNGYPLLTYGQSVNITMTNLGEGSSITKFSMIKLSSVTHSINTDVRYLEYSAAKGNMSGAGTSYQLTTVGGANGPNILTPGYYFLFAINDKGVPSVAKVVQVL